MPASTSASGMFGVTTSASGSSSRTDRVDRGLLEQPVAALGDHHRIDDQVREAEASDRGGHRLDDRGVRQHAGLDRVGADVADNRLDLRGDEIGATAPPTAVTPSVFCAVTAVIALVP